MKLFKSVSDLGSPSGIWGNFAINITCCVIFDFRPAFMVGAIVNGLIDDRFIQRQEG